MPSAPRAWRLLLDAPQTGARNMATDEALARAHLEAALPPTLRFYSWSPPCLSLGRLQKLDGPLQVLGERRAGLDWVRRPSGGRGVWHEAEVTYSVAIALEDLPVEFRSTVGAYEWLSRPLLRGLRSLGVCATLASSTSGERGERNCFLSSSQADAVVDGRKLIGGAQCRFEAGGRTAVLQHGSILIGLDSHAWARALGEEPGRMGERALSLRELGVQGSVQDVGTRVQRAVAQALAEEAEVEEARLSPREEEMSGELERRKYVSEAWSRRGAFGEQVRGAA